MSDGNSQCALCNQQVSSHSLLCHECNTRRLAAASFARIASGSGLTWANVEEFSEVNWIEWVKAWEEKTGETLPKM